MRTNPHRDDSRHGGHVATNEYTHQAVLGGSTARKRMATSLSAFGMDVIGAYAFAFFPAYVFGGYAPG